MRLVVIGGVAAGMSAAARARRVDSRLDITVLEQGRHVSWAACGLPYLVEGQVKREEELVLHSPQGFAQERNVTVRTGAKVASISLARRQVGLAGGEPIPFDRLVIATGAQLDRGRIAGAGQPHVFSLDSLAEAARLRDFLRRRQARKAVIAGGGYIGLEAAGALRAYGLQVEVLEAGGTLLDRDDPALVRRLTAHLERFRVSVRLYTPVQAVESDAVLAGPESRERIACDLVVLASGLRPRVDLAEAAGIRLGRTGAIETSDRMETSIDGVYAAGDCAETRHIVTNRPAWLPLGTTANKTGRVAGANAAGAREHFRGVAGTSIVRVCGLAVATTGLSAAQARREGFDPAAASIEAPERARYFRGKRTLVELVADRRSRRLLGATVVGGDGAAGRINVVATALLGSLRVDDVLDADLSYAPPYASVWDPLLIAAQQLRRALS